MTYKQLLDEVYTLFEKKDIQYAVSDADILFEHFMNISKSRYLLVKDEEADPDREKLFRAAVEKRLDGMPVQYITGTQCFMGFDFDVSPAVLIPRFDTEILVSYVLENESASLEVLDMCTGSGCIILSLIGLNSNINGTAADISEEALKVAKNNCDKLGFKCEFIQTDLFDKINNQFDVIVSNPPYIESQVIEGLDVNVKDYEPRLALDGGADGLDIYRRIINEAPEYLKSGGRLYFEIGYNQGEAVSELLNKRGFTGVEIRKDLAGLNRCVRAVFNK